MKKKNKEENFNQANEIPKKIHYVWMGGSEKSELVIRCIESWKKYMPDYEIIEWNESNFDINCCNYVRKAYEAKKWAFVSDVARTYVLKEYGGIYFDTDIELFSAPQDIFDVGEVILGFDGKYLLSTGVMATIPHHKVFELLWLQYNESDFKNSDLEETINTRITIIVLDYIRKRRMTNGEYLINSIRIYPKTYFSNNLKDDVSPVFAIHHFEGSWKKKVELTWFQYILFLFKFIFLQAMSVFMSNKTYINLDKVIWQCALEKTEKNVKLGAKIHKRL